MPKPSWQGAAGGAVTGASIGSAGGPYGAAAGGVIGGLLGLFGGGGKGGSSGTKKEKLKKVPTGTPEQEQFGQDLMAMLQGMRQPGGGYDLANQYNNSLLGPNQQEAYNNFSSPYLQQFQEQVLPMIGERFAGAGALSSSGFGQALGGAGAGLQSQLAQLFSGLQQQAAGQQYGQFNQMANTGLNYQPFAYYQKPGGATQAGGFMQGFDPSSLSGIFDMFKGQGGGNPAAGSGGGTMDMSSFLQNYPSNPNLT